MQVVHQDLFDVTEGIIAHQVNCGGVMGAGVAKIVKDKYPRAFDKYSEWCDKFAPEQLLGTTQFVKVSDDPILWIANVFSQNEHGTHQKQTNYGAIATGFKYLFDNAGNNEIYIPYLLGCGLGGGDWKVVEEIIDFVCPGAIACSLDPL